MRTLMKQGAAIIAMAIGAVSANAGTITDYQVIGSNNYVTNTATGQEWLQWTETSGMTVSTALSAFSAGGWRIATNSDIAGLYNDFFGPGWDSNENTTQKLEDLSTPAYGDGVDPSFQLGQLFGWTVWADSVLVNDGVTDPFFLSLYETSAIFGTDEDGDGVINTVDATSEYQYRCGSDCIESYAESAAINSDGLDPDAPFEDDFGVALIREASVVDMSEPGTLALLGLGLLGLGLARRNSHR